MGDPDLRLSRVRGEALWRRTRGDALELLDAAVQRWVPPGASRERIEHGISAHRRPHSPRMAPLLECFAELRPSAMLVQVGANRDPERQPLRAAAAARRWRAVVVEPLPGALEFLRLSYPHLSEEAFERAAIAPADGEGPFYHLAEATGPGGWSDAPGALTRTGLLFRRRFGADREDEVLEIQAPRLTLESLFRRHGIESFDVLAVDTEGYDHEILQQVDFDRLRPALVVYESGHLAPETRLGCARRLHSFGYETIEHGRDTWCLRPSALSGSEAAVLEPIWHWTVRYDPTRPLRGTELLRAGARRVLRRSQNHSHGSPELFPLSEAERRYLKTGYDERVPLPEGAAEYLSSANPRLQELRRSYAELDLGAVQHHLWRPARVAEEVDLRYFRGDNLYQWHYPDHPRAMALSLFIYMRHLEARGGGSLLERLSEDGSFGCWTCEVAGYGKVSRDLLDSISEILFLDRQLDVLGSSGLRMLDVGAGYGRLAHRMAAAIPSLADYCCVDAVPESTFLSEYYLAFRGCSPPARVTPLTAIEASLRPGSFDLALNIHSFSECTLAAIEWWMGQLARLEVPHLFVVPNEAEGIVSRELDGGYHDAMPALEAAGYRAIACERAISDPAARDLLRINDNFYLFELAK